MGKNVLWVMPLAVVLALHPIWIVKMLAFIVIIFVIAIIHEAGHHLTCKAFGVRVDEFSLGLGKLLWFTRIGETQYSIRAVPIAAFVKPAGMNAEEAKEEGYVDPGERSFNRKPSWIKHLILIAGPAFNIISTVMVFTLVFTFISYDENTIKVKEVAPGRPAAEAGVQEGDIILTMDGVAVTNQRKGITYINDHAGVAITMTVLRGSEIATITVTPKLEEGQGRIGIISQAYLLQPTSLEVEALEPGSAAEKLGLKAGDRVIAMDGVDIVRYDVGVTYLKEKSGADVKLKVRREGKEQEISVPLKDERGLLSLGARVKPAVVAENRTLPFGEALKQAMAFTQESVIEAYKAALSMFGNSFKGKLPDEIGGPVSIVRVVASQVDEGETPTIFRNLIHVFALLSMAIGVFNLLPVPALDGGRMFVILVRDTLDLGYMVIFRRKPAASLLTDRMEDYVNFAGVVLLLLLLVVVTFKDFRDLLAPRERPNPTFKTSPAPSPSPSVAP